MSAATTERPATRGTSNANERGNSDTRRQRREWLVETYRADVDLIVVTDGPAGEWVMAVAHGASLDRNVLPVELPHASIVRACRCYRCGVLLTVDTVTVDRIKAGAHGGKYGTPRRDEREGRTNIRPGCGPCNSETGGGLRG